MQLLFQCLANVYSFKVIKAAIHQKHENARETVCAKLTTIGPFFGYSPFNGLSPLTLPWYF